MQQDEITSTIQPQVLQLSLCGVLTHFFIHFHSSLVAPGHNFQSAKGKKTSLRTIRLQDGKSVHLRPAPEVLPICVGAGRAPPEEGTGCKTACAQAPSFSFQLSVSDRRPLRTVNPPADGVCLSAAESRQTLRR